MDVLYGREAIVSMLEGILDVVNHGSASREPPYDMEDIYTEGYRNAIKGLLVRFGETRFSNPVKPTIVCLCGSTRFKDAFMKAYRDETLSGKIVLSVGVMLHQGDEPISSDDPVKAGLDELHLRKIDLADEVLILNVGGYIGESTARELKYAVAGGKMIRFLEPDKRPGFSDLSR